MTCAQEPAAKAAKTTAGEAFEDVLYGSESEIEDSEDDDAPAARRKGTKDFGARLRVDDDEPMDLLAGTASRVTSSSARCSSPASLWLTAFFLCTCRCAGPAPA
jgi:hypothetical protein